MAGGLDASPAQQRHSATAWSHIQLNLENLQGGLAPFTLLGLSPDSAGLRGNTFSPEIPSGFPFLQLVLLLHLHLLHGVDLLLCVDSPSTCLFAGIVPSWAGFCGVGILWSILALPVPLGTLQCPGMSGLMLLPRGGEYFGTRGLEEVRCQLENHPMCPWGHLRANPSQAEPAG